MADPASALLCAAVMAALWTVIGWPIARCVDDRVPAWCLAPALGFAVHSVVALPLLGLLGMSRITVIAVSIACCALSYAAGRMVQKTTAPEPWSRALIVSIIVAAALVALAPAMAALPKITSEGVRLSASIFDHAKIAMIDEMMRAGVPPHNPFFHEASTPDRLAYYYLWHFAAAVLGTMTGATGWEADAALTWFTAFASLLVMIGLCARFGGKAAAPFVVLLLAASASLRTVIEWAGIDPANAYLRPASGLAGWLFQSTWAPQHLAAATCVLLAGLLLVRIAARTDWLASVVLALVVAAGYESSIWVGGVSFAIVAVVIALYLLGSIEPQRRVGFIVRALVAAAIALAFSFPLLREQIAVGNARGGGAPIAVTHLPVLGSALGSSRLLDLPAFWLVYLPVEFAAFYPAGLVGLVALLKARSTRGIVMPLALLAGASLAVAWLLRSTVAYNNDLGWRAILPAILLLIVFAATAISHWPLKSARIATLLAALCGLLTAPETLLYLREDIVATRLPAEPQFARTPDLWRAVRRHTAADERIANNPGFLADMTPWGVNISWALLAQRRSCYAGYDLAIAFAPVAEAERAAIDQRFQRVFAGAPLGDDIEQLAQRFGCDTLVVTPQDGAWQRDPFVADGPYRLVESRADSWRIYRRTAR